VGCAAHVLRLAEAVSGYEVSDTGSLALIDGWEHLRRLGLASGSSPTPELSLDWINPPLRVWEMIDPRQKCTCGRRSLCYAPFSRKFGRLTPDLVLHSNSG
jgi:hypothetical protein